MSTEVKEIQVTTAPPNDLFENARYHGSRRSLLGSILKEEIPFNTQMQLNRRIYVMRHGERLDYIFPNFSSSCFDSSGNYKRINLNMPKVLPRRDNPVENWEKDTPLTNMGLFQAKMIGEGVKTSGHTFDTVICSPLYRCIQTCDAFLDGLGLKDKIKICIDPGLYEWIAFGKLQGHEGMAEYFTPQELVDMGYNINLNYQPAITIAQLKEAKDESLHDAFKRNEAVLDKALTDESSKSIFIVAHGANLLSCTNKFVNDDAVEKMKVFSLFKKVSYCGFVAIEERLDKSKWEYISPPLTCITHAGNNYDESERLNKVKENLKKHRNTIFGNN